LYKTILVPLDGSERAEAILPHVEELAQRYEAEVIFLQVIEPPHPITGPEGTYMEMYQEEAERRVEQAESYLAGLKGEFREKGIQARTRVAHGPIVKAILDTAESQDVDLVAIASHGRSGLSQVFYGSVAAGVLQRIDRPLLLVRARGSL